MKELAEKVLAAYQKGELQNALDFAAEYNGACREAFLENLNVNTATDFAASAVMYAQITKQLRKPWKAFPVLNEMHGCVRFLEDFIQDRELLSSTCLSIATSFEDGNYIPEAIYFYRKVLTCGTDPDALKGAALSVVFLDKYFYKTVSKEEREELVRAVGKEEFSGLSAEADEMLSKSLSFDEVEKEERFLAIRYELEEKVEQALLSEYQNTTDPYCYRYWYAKKRILNEEYGIDWKSPAECNPQIRFC